MQTRVSTKGQVVLPVAVRQRLGIRPGDALDISIEQDRIVLKATDTKKYQARIIDDPVTGFPVIDVGPEAPVLTSEMVRELLVDFP
jgi:AbrB family looped-hinge helix DNA binding protein